MPPGALGSRGKSSIKVEYASSSVSSFHCLKKKEFINSNADVNVEVEISKKLTALLYSFVYGQHWLSLYDKMKIPIPDLKQNSFRK
jgi:hypothetical protein